MQRSVQAGRQGLTEEKYDELLNFTDSDKFTEREKVALTYTSAIAWNSDIADDALWEKLSAGGRKDRCGWLQDRFGVSWQIIPSVLGKLLGDPDPEKSKRVMMAMLQMDKIDIKRLQEAYEQG